MIAVSILRRETNDFRPDDAGDTGPEARRKADDRVEGRRRLDVPAGAAAKDVPVRRVQGAAGERGDAPEDVAERATRNFRGKTDGGGCATRGELRAEDLVVGSARYGDLFVSVSEGDQ